MNIRQIPGYFATSCKVLALLTVCFLAIPVATATDLSGRAIMDEVAERHDKPFEFEVQKMRLIDRSGNEELRDVKRYAREVTKEDTHFLMAFHSPSGIRGTALLTWQHDNKDDDQWLYLPAQGKKAKRVAKGGKKNYFMGTDYTFEDLISESRDKFTYNRLEDISEDNRKLFVVEAFPKDESVKEETGYKFRRMFIDQEIFFVIRTEYFDKRGRFIKSQTAHEVAQVDGKTFRAKKNIMKNKKLKHETHVTILERTFDETDVPEKLFNTRYITRNKHMR